MIKLRLIATVFECSFRGPLIIYVEEGRQLRKIFCTVFQIFVEPSDSVCGERLLSTWPSSIPFIWCDWDLDYPV